MDKMNFFNSRLRLPAAASPLRFSLFFSQHTAIGSRACDAYHFADLIGIVLLMEADGESGIRLIKLHSTAMNPAAGQGMPGRNKRIIYEKYGFFKA